MRRRDVRILALLWSSSSSLQGAVQESTYSTNEWPGSLESDVLRAVCLTVRRNSARWAVGDTAGDGWHRQSFLLDSSQQVAADDKYGCASTSVTFSFNLQARNAGVTACEQIRSSRTLPLVEGNRQEKLVGIGQGECGSTASGERTPEKLAKTGEKFQKKKRRGRRK